MPVAGVWPRYEEVVPARRHLIQFACSRATTVLLGLAVSGTGGQRHAETCSDEVQTVAASADEARLEVEIHHEDGEPALVVLQVVPA